MELEARDASQTTNKMNDAFSLLEQLAQWVTCYLCTHHLEGGYTPFLESLLPCMQKWQCSYGPTGQVLQWKFLFSFTLGSTSFTINVIAIFPFFRQEKWSPEDWSDLLTTILHYQKLNFTFCMPMSHFTVLYLNVKRAISDVLLASVYDAQTHTVLGKVDSLDYIIYNRKISCNYHVELSLAIWNVYVSSWWPIIWVAGAVRSRK